MKKKAFTLIELLVVIAIIAICIGFAAGLAHRHTNPEPASPPSDSPASK
jgi:prepilin-type N-terminal cleavage/methylation domain-containing protein